MVKKREWKPHHQGRAEPKRSVTRETRKGTGTTTLSLHKNKRGSHSSNAHEATPTPLKLKLHPPTQKKTC